MIALASLQNRHKKIPISKISHSLIYEIMDGKPLYYKGFEEVVNGKKTL